jgi:hypothetical protein
MLRSLAILAAAFFLFAGRAAFAADSGIKGDPIAGGPGATVADSSAPSDGQQGQKTKAKRDVKSPALRSISPQLLKTPAPASEPSAPDGGQAGDPIGGMAGDHAPVPEKP